jgi:hypothetical protein
MVLPTPPYLYDDPRLVYDEHCFFYDGGYDSVCLGAPTAVIVRAGGSRKKAKPYLNVFVRCCVCKVNGEEIPCDDLAGWVRFAGEDEPLTVFVNGVAVRMKTPYATGYLKNLVTGTNQVDGVNLSLQFLQKLKDEGPECVVEPETDTNNNIDVKIIEPYDNIEIKCDLIPVSTGSLKVESKIITPKKKQNE